MDPGTDHLDLISHSTRITLHRHVGLRFANPTYACWEIAYIEIAMPDCMKKMPWPFALDPGRISPDHAAIRAEQQ